MKVSDLVKKAGSVVALAKAVDATRQAVHTWIKKGDSMPPLYLDALRYRRPEWFKDL